MGVCAPNSGTVVVAIYGHRPSSPLYLPIFVCPVSAGFPSPAEDYTDGKLDLNEFLVTHPSATFFLRVWGDSMRRAGIHEGDTIIVDRAAEPVAGRVVVACVGGELLVKRLRLSGGRMMLVAECEAGEHYPPITLGEDATIWGVVTRVLHTP